MEKIKKALSLTERVLYYQKTGLGYEELVQDLALQIYYYPLRKRWGDEDDAGDFYLFVYPRLTRMLQNYQPKQIPFEHYFHVNLYWLLHSYFKRKQQTESTWRIKPCINYYMQSGSETENSGEPVAPGADADEVICESFLTTAVALPHNGSYVFQLLKKFFKLNEQGVVSNATGKYRLLILILRYGSCLKEEELTYLAAMADYDFKQLKEHLENLKVITEKKTRKLEALCGKRNQVFFRCCLLEEQAVKNPHQEKSDGLAVKISNYREKMASYSRQLAGHKLYPSYRKIARELGLPRGTVDTAVRSIKKSLANIYPEQKKGYAGLHEDSISIEQPA